MKPVDDVPATERAAAFLVGRSGHAAEGIFYGTDRGGLDDCFLSPTIFKVVPQLASRTIGHQEPANPRYPDSFHAGCEVQVVGRPDDDYVFLRFLILIEPRQSRFYAVLGNLTALHASPVLLNRYAVVQLKESSEATFSAILPLSECDPAILTRLQSGADAYVSDITAAQLKRGEHGLQAKVLPPMQPPAIQTRRSTTTTAAPAAAAPAAAARGAAVIDTGGGRRWRQRGCRS